MLKMKSISHPNFIVDTYCFCYHSIVMSGRKEQRLKNCLTNYNIIIRFELHSLLLCYFN